MDDLYIELEDFKDSAKFIFGLNVGSVEVTGFDMLNNPYVEFKGYQQQYWKNIAKYFELEICSEEYISSFIQPATRPLYT